MSLICRFALAKGMCQSEICGLQIEDIDRRNKTAIIRDRKDPKNKQGNDQTVPLLVDAWTILEPLIVNRESGFAFPYQADQLQPLSSSQSNFPNNLNDPHRNSDHKHAEMLCEMKN
jgi:integrase